MKRKIIGIMTAVVMTAASLTGCSIKPTSHTSEEESASDKVMYKPTEKIMQADFESGLIQINNDVFQQGGYITVEELYEQYAEKYEFAYEDKPYEEAKNDPLEFDDYEFDNYCLLLTPKYGESQNKVAVCVTNMTNPDESIPLSEAQVINCDAYTDMGTDVYTPLWTPKGFSSKMRNDYGWWHQPEDQKAFNHDLSVDNLIKLLESEGYENATDDKDSPFDSSMFFADMENAINQFAEIPGNKRQIELFVKGSPNLAGRAPTFNYEFEIDPDTDTICYAKCYVLFTDKDTLD